MAHIRCTTKLEINGSKLDKFPLIITNNLKVHILSLEYFLHKRTSVQATTLFTYAQHIADFLSQLEVENDGLTCEDPEYREWDEIDDNWIEAYSAELISRYESESDNKKNYVGSLLSTVVGYLKWTQTSGYTTNLIGIGEDNRIKLNTSSSKKGDQTILPLAKKLSKEKSPRRTAPRMDWIDVVKANLQVKSGELRVRDELMIDWCVGIGLRAHEVCSLTISQLPSKKSAEDAYINEQNVFINIVISKGSKPKRVPVSALLIKKTWDFVEIDRERVLSQVKSKAKEQRIPFVDSGILFPSQTTGIKVHSRTFSNKIRKAFLKAVEVGELAEDQVVWTHGLRHRHATDVLQGLDNKGVKNPERIAKQSTRHQHEDMLETYTVSRFHEDV
ncbi:tyrosine-type recombinase/integrase [Vibrio vulnificus]|uniref:tyrosine-type recombinase/integrase n=1 Tax=Vibrio parahaemolyticus TaxID=670 RepID=UPI0013761573|nr:tyrosine-type recombinase/integrase [Vibrio parahaemolyticus]EJG0639802.1 tyrosine-type recombinase/integrase [Vibrio parahaemolyticus]EJG0927666.1 tyrosine-type recombinase/integrase [Vibrio parahaemolyticus]EJG1046888.1 tyrosine-type recombinase/integrase [Vibrio parahaemolyticus]EJG1080758.1 tyrosine-type recombinase/integrase [Vibrio parahaemolyticus]EJG1095423.1 tyrosine-type recombinase/integrase [Vibrio parahaemolyticus]